MSSSTLIAIPSSLWSFAVQNIVVLVVCAVVGALVAYANRH